MSITRERYDEAEGLSLETLEALEFDRQVMAEDLARWIARTAAGGDGWYNADETQGFAIRAAEALVRIDVDILIMRAEA